MSVINTNVKSLVAQSALAANNTKLATAMERLSTGSRINSAKDDAAGLAISTRMDSQVRGLNVAIRNASDGISLVQTAEGAMEEIGSMLQRMRELALQSSSDVNTAADRSALDSEVQQLKSEIDRIVNTTRFNDKKLLDGSFSGNLQIGAKSGETMAVAVNNISTLGLGSISGASAGAGVVEASFVGREATPTVSKMTFAANGTFDFDLNLDVDGVTVTVAVTDAVVANGSAAGVVDAINQAIADEIAAGTASAAQIPDSFRFTYNGKSVNIENLTGGDIGVANYVSSSSATMSFSTISGDVTSTDAILGSNATAITAFDVSEQTVTRRDPSILVVGTDNTETLTSGDFVRINLTSGGTQHTLEFEATAGGEDIEDIVAGWKEDPNYETSGYYISYDSANDQVSVERYDGAAFTVSGNHLDSNYGAVATAITFDSISANGTAVASATSLMDAGSESVVAKALRSDQPNEIALRLENTAAWAASDTVALTLVSGGVTTVVTTGALAGGEDFDGVFALLRDDAAGTDYEIGKDGSGRLVVTRTDGADFSIGVTADNAGTAIATATLKTATGVDLVARTSNLEVAAPDSPLTMYLTFNGNDTYNFTVGSVGGTGATNVTSAFEVDYTGTSSNLQSIADDLQGLLSTIQGPNANNFDFSVSVENGRIRIDENNGYAFELANFSSDGAGRISVVAGAGQESASGDSIALLDDTVYATTANSVGEQASGGGNAYTDPTVVNLQFAANSAGLDGDVYSFEISDGLRTATVTNVFRDTSGTGPDATMLSAITTALSRAGMDEYISVADVDSTDADDGAFTLTNSLGGMIRIQNFSSDNDTTVEVTAGTGTTGIDRFLDDGYNVDDGAVIRSINVLSASASQDAVDVIDNALADVSAERANLGAIQNRLEHTINNLTNISTNTSASRSRIQDTDYGVETANLAKSQIIQQAATAMLAQANQSSQSVLSLLQ